MASRQHLVDLDFNNVAKILNLLPGSASGEAVTYEQLQGAIEGLNWKDDVRVASTANITLSGPGASIDGVTMANGDRFLAKNQTTVAENGFYIFNGAAVAATRSSDASTFAELEGAVTIVTEGTANAGTSWRQTQVNGVIGTNDVVFAAFLSSSPDASETTKGILELATQAETDTGTDDVRALTPLKLKNSKWFNQSKIFTIGDNSATSFNCDHNLNTRNVSATVFRNSGNYDTVLVGETRPTVNRVTLTFNAAPTSNAFIAVVQGPLV